MTGGTSRVEFGCWLKVDSSHELCFLPPGKQSALKSRSKESANGLAAFLAVVQRPMVHIHADESIRQVAAHVAGILERVPNCFSAMIQAVLDAGRQNI